MSENVSIIGAGTAGLIAAKHTARLGIETRVYDQRARPGMPIHASGIVSETGLNTLGMDYKNAITNKLIGANIHAGGKVFRVRAKDPIAFVLDRMKLNEICYDEAERAGAKIGMGKRIVADAFDSMARNGVLIGADGAVSSVARHFSMGHMADHVLTYKKEFNVKIDEPGIVNLFFDRNVSPGLFGWMCPNANDILEVGVGISPKYGNSAHAMSKFVKTEEVSAIIDGAKELGGGASIIPLARRKKIYDNRGVLLVGDAAGQVKATTGGGIVFGGNGAVLAAEIATEHIRNGMPLSVYEKRYAKRYGTDMLFHKMINRIYSNFGHTALGAMITISNAIGIDGFLGKYGDMDRPSLMLKRFFLRTLSE